MAWTDWHWITFTRRFSWFLLQKLLQCFCLFFHLWLSQQRPLWPYLEPFNGTRHSSYSWSIGVVVVMVVFVLMVVVKRNVNWVTSLGCWKIEETPQVHYITRPFLRMIGRIGWLKRSMAKHVIQAPWLRGTLSPYVDSSSWLILRSSSLGMNHSNGAQPWPQDNAESGKRPNAENSASFQAFSEGGIFHELRLCQNVIHLSR